MAALDAVEEVGLDTAAPPVVVVHQIERPSEVTVTDQTHPQLESLYFVALYRTSAILGRMTRADRERIEATLNGRVGPNSEILEGWTYGSRAQLMEQIGGQGWLTEDHFDQADANPTLQQEITLQ